VCPPVRTPFFGFLLWFSSIVFGHIRFISSPGFLALRARHRCPYFILLLLSLAFGFTIKSLDKRWYIGFGFI
jgi:hypothetical protein